MVAERDVLADERPQCIDGHVPVVTRRSEDAVDVLVRAARDHEVEGAGLEVCSNDALDGGRKGVVRMSPTTTVAGSRSSPLTYSQWKSSGSR